MTKNINGFFATYHIKTKYLIKMIYFSLSIWIATSTPLFPRTHFWTFAANNFFKPFKLFPQEPLKDENHRITIPMNWEFHWRTLLLSFLKPKEGSTIQNSYCGVCGPSWGINPYGIQQPSLQAILAGPSPTSQPSTPGRRAHLLLTSHLQSLTFSRKVRVALNPAGLLAWCHCQEQRRRLLPRLSENCIITSL